MSETLEERVDRLEQVLEEIRAELLDLLDAVIEHQASCPAIAA